MKQSGWKMKERNLFFPIKKFFEHKGFKVSAEVGISMALCDIVCFNDEDILLAIEMKMSLSKKVIHQAYLHQIAADYVYVAVPTKPRDLSLCEKHGIGVLKIEDNKVIELLPPTHNKILHGSKERFLFNAKWVYKNNPDTIPGLPQMKGEGPRIECQKDVNRYLRTNPNASWKEIWENVDNHYCSSGSMASVIYK